MREARFTVWQFVSLYPLPVLYVCIGSAGVEHPDGAR